MRIRHCDTLAVKDEISALLDQHYPITSYIVTRSISPDCAMEIKIELVLPCRYEDNPYEGVGIEVSE